MIKLSKPKTNPSRITGPFALLAAFFVTLEVLLSIWIYKAGGPGERIFAGSLMAALFAIFLFKFFASNLARNPPSIPEDTLIDPEEIANKEADSNQQKNSGLEQIVGPDRLYLVNKPPANWEVKELTLSEWIDPVAQN